MHNPLLWSNYIRCIIIPHFGYFEQVFFQKIAPAFRTIEEEAERMVNDKYEQLVKQPGNPDADLDLSDLAEETHESGIEYYLIIRGIEQGITNLFAVAMYHLFEQELLLIHKSELLRPWEQNDERLLDLDELKRRIKNSGIDLEAFRSWNKLEELRFVANTVKHADGRSSAALKKLRLDMFIPPDLRAEKVNVEISPTTQVFLPLAGEDLYVTAEDISSYFRAIQDFCGELAINLDSLAMKNS
ncbi:hypothetical protein [Neomoorella thermoacetica]|uniref:hypothetical protein n=1 Tax=Neomoorella thermoacetica TaxID=1525 RepID=UPI0008FB9559|nr:hypothetical protein [Moorella thermoacetica]APC08566.1 hypothetical protein MTJW_14070 [Moorella thermoacetica]